MTQLTAGAVNSMNNNQAAGIRPTLQLIDVNFMRFLGSAPRARAGTGVRGLNNENLQ